MKENKKEVSECSKKRAADGAAVAKDEEEPVMMEIEDAPVGMIVEQIIAAVYQGSPGGSNDETTEDAGTAKVVPNIEATDVDNKELEEDKLEIEIVEIAHRQDHECWARR